MIPGAVITWPRFSFPCGADPAQARARTGLSLPLPQAYQVHVWAAWLDLPASAREEYQKVLSIGELDQASRFHFDRDRNRYVSAHGVLRQVLGSYLGRPAASLEFERGTNGKPGLAAEARSCGLQFNLAHSEALALIAVALDTPVGVDVERIRGLPDGEQLVTRFFSHREASDYRLLPEHQRTEAFFNLWTRKEAWLKATGEGIAHLLDQVEVTFRPGEPARLLSLSQGFPQPSDWSLFDLSPAPGFAAACVVAGSRAEPECRCWETQFSEES